MYWFPHPVLLSPVLFFFLTEHTSQDIFGTNKADHLQFIGDYRSSVANCGHRVTWGKKQNKKQNKAKTTVNSCCSINVQISYVNWKSGRHHGSNRQQMNERLWYNNQMLDMVWPLCAVVIIINCMHLSCMTVIKCIYHRINQWCMNRGCERMSHTQKWYCGGKNVNAVHC